VKIAVPLKNPVTRPLSSFHEKLGGNIHTVMAPRRCHSLNAASGMGPWRATNILNLRLGPLVFWTPGAAEAAIENQHKVENRAAQLGFIKLVPKKETGAKRVVK